MNYAKIEKALRKAGAFTKVGTMKSLFAHTIDYHFIYAAKSGKIRPIRWTGNARHRILIGENKWDASLVLLNALGIAHKEGNDAPRGGQEGRYIQIVGIRKFRNCIETLESLAK